MPNAYNILPDRFEDNRHISIVEGLEKIGYNVVHGLGKNVVHRLGKPADDRDVLVTWTLQRGHKEITAQKFEQQGGRVIVAEEAYLQNIQGEKCFALSLHDHNGAGEWRIGDSRRWSNFYVPVRPWKKLSNGYILIREQRGIGSTRMASPPGWHEEVTLKLNKMFPEYRTIFRCHPKSRIHSERAKSQPNLLEHLSGARVLVTWCSADGVQALIEGVPVVYQAPSWICKNAASNSLESVSNPYFRDSTRMRALQDLAWAQWRVSEIKSGEAFKWLLQ